MTNNRYKILSANILKSGISLEPLGIAEYAWEKNLVIEILNILNDKRIPVLGGDVYKIVDNEIKSTYDGWYIDKDETPEFVRKSLDMAKSYIEEYEHLNEGKYLYSLVF